MARPKRTVIAEYNGMRNDVGTGNLPDSYGEYAQNIRMDKNGVLMPRKGTSTASVTAFASPIERIQQVDTAPGPCVIVQHGSTLYANRIGVGDIDIGGTDYYRFYATSKDAPEKQVMQYRTLTPFDFVPAPLEGPTFVAATGGYTVTIYYQKAPGSPSAIPDINPYIAGGDMVLDGQIAHSWTMQKDFVDQGFTSVFVPSTATNWQFRYTMINGAQGPLSLSAAIPFP